MNGTCFILGTLSKSLRGRQGLFQNVLVPVTPVECELGSWLQSHSLKVRHWLRPVLLSVFEFSWRGSRELGLPLGMSTPLAYKHTS